ncbi:hypothetical protein HAX54_016698 [Datura stramonium]|uniref:Uncharacterized protein n=1 Tax=Datura stramonium TaxID=4076 RepID=A0ABS8UJB8_DATST|nr:hypothetical protein [Datura stramonium]
MRMQTPIDDKNDEATLDSLLETDESQVRGENDKEKEMPKAEQGRDCVCNLKRWVAVIMNFAGETIQEFKEMVNAMVGMDSYSFTPKTLYLDLKSRETPLAKPFIKEPPVLDFKYNKKTYTRS